MLSTSVISNKSETVTAESKKFNDKANEIAKNINRFPTSSVIQNSLNDNNYNNNNSITNSDNNENNININEPTFQKIELDDTSMIKVGDVIFYCKAVGYDTVRILKCHPGPPATPESYIHR